jgi:c-di-GMP-binding flagellar brake protein YcgR
MIPKSFTGKERRAYVRLQHALPVRLRIDVSQTGKTYTAMTRNISRGGLCVEIADEVEELSEKINFLGPKIGVDIDTLTPEQKAAVSAKSIWINSRVDWARKPTRKKRTMLMGLEFEDMTEETRRRINDFIVKEMVNRYQKSD